MKLGAVSCMNHLLGLRPKRGEDTKYLQLPVRFCGQMCFRDFVLEEVTRFGGSQAGDYHPPSLTRWRGYCPSFPGHGDLELSVF